MEELERICQALCGKLKDKGIPNLLTKREDSQKLMEQVYREFAQHKIIQKKFNSNFPDFLNDLLFWSYQLRLKPESIAKIPEFETIKGEDHQFLGRVDLFGLIDYLNQTYSKKYSGYDQFRFGKRISALNKELTLVASFNENPWDNIFNDYDHYRGLDGHQICIFNRAKHALASYLHSAHPYIHYLNINSPELPQRPLCTAILVEGYTEEEKQERSAPSLQPYLIVDGVLANFQELEKEAQKEIFHFTLRSIQAFALRKQRKLFLNAEHSGNQREPVEFLSYVAKKEEDFSVKIERVPHPRTGKLICRPKFPSGMINERKFLTPLATELISSAASRSRDRVYYHGEQYLETFFLENKSIFPTQEATPFYKPEGRARGIEISCSDSKIEEYLRNTGIDSSSTLRAIASLEPVDSKFQLKQLKEGIISSSIFGVIGTGLSYYLINSQIDNGFSWIKTILGVGGAICGLGGLVATYNAISAWARFTPNNQEEIVLDQGFYFLGERISSRKTAVEEQYGHLIQPVSSLEDLEYPASSAQNPYRFIDYLVLNKIKTKTDLRKEYQDHGSIDGASIEVEVPYFCGSFVAERMGEQKKFRFCFKGNSPPKKFADLLKEAEEESEVALIYKKYSSGKEEEYAPFEVIKVYRQKDIDERMKSILTSPSAHT
ncbi:MAG: hypothetical protein V2A62_01255 [Candidatus Woesearchaeota archaeon]